MRATVRIVILPILWLKMWTNYLYWWSKDQRVSIVLGTMVRVGSQYQIWYWIFLFWFTSLSFQQKATAKVIQFDASQKKMTHGIVHPQQFTELISATPTLGTCRSAKEGLFSQLEVPKGYAQISPFTSLNSEWYLCGSHDLIGIVSSSSSSNSFLCGKDTQ